MSPMKKFGLFLGGLLWVLCTASCAVAIPAATTATSVAVDGLVVPATTAMNHRILQDSPVPPEDTTDDTTDGNTDENTDDKTDDQATGEEEVPVDQPGDVQVTVPPEGGENGDAEDTPVRTELVRLLPFDVQLAMTTSSRQVDVDSLKDIIQGWMWESFDEQATGKGLISGNGTTFVSLALEVRTNGGRRARSLRVRQLQEETGSSITVVTANFEGVTLWERVESTTTAVNPEIVQVMQRATFLDENVLLAKLRLADESTGLGSAVAKVRAFIVDTDTTVSTSNANEDDNGDVLQIIIIVAIVVACLAFGLLMFAVIWAWRTDQARRDYNSKGGSKNNNNNNTHAIAQIATQSESFELENRSPTGMSPPVVAIPRKEKSTYEKSAYVKSAYATSTAPAPVVTSTISNSKDYTVESNDFSELPSPADYDGSVISEDISTSLTAYYRSGMAGYGASNSGRQAPAAAAAAAAGDFNDNASMSSMDSYGYSLDGYAPSLGPAPQGYPVGSSLYNGLIKDPDTDYSEEEEEAQDYSKYNNNTDTEEEGI